MATNPDIDDFLAQFEHVSAPAWQTADDAGRLSIEGFIAETQETGLARSRGQMRIAEHGTETHSARVDHTGRMLIALQRAVRGVAAGLEGVRSIVGPLPTELVQSTYLRLFASPLPGSILLEVEAETSAFDEAYPDGQRTIEGPGESLLDRSATTLIDVLVLISGAPPGSDEMTQRLLDLGPRASSAIKLFADTVTAGSFDVDFSWQRFAQPTVHARVDEVSAAWISSVIDGSLLDAEPVTLTGVLHTISDRRQLDLELATREILSIERGAVEVGTLRVGQEVTVDALVRVAVRPAGDERRTYTAVRITPASAVGD